MQIAIISDVHDNIPNLQKVLAYCQKEKIVTLICCGDLATPETLDYLRINFSGKIYYTFGNMDNDHLRDFEFSHNHKNMTIYSNYGEISIAKKKISFVHFPDKAKQLAESGKFDFVFYGHTHKPWEEMVGNCKMLNPGNVAGTFYTPTFAVWHTESGRFDLILIHKLK